MVFSVHNELRISGGEEAERRGALRMLAARDFGAEPPDEEAARPLEGGGLLLRFDSVDVLPEEELRAAALAFPGLDLGLLYVSLDGGFLGLLAAAAGELSDRSLDLEEEDARVLGRLGEEEFFAKARGLLDADLNPSG